MVTRYLTALHCTEKEWQSYEHITHNTTPWKTRQSNDIELHLIFFWDNTNNFGNICTIAFITFINIMQKSGPKHVSKNDHQDSFTGHTTFPARPSDIFGDLWLETCARDYVILNWVTEDDRAASDIWNLKITCPRRRHHVTIFDRDYNTPDDDSVCYIWASAVKQSRDDCCKGGRLTRKSGIEICLCETHTESVQPSPNKLRVCNHLPNTWDLIGGTGSKLTPIDCNQFLVGWLKGSNWSHRIAG